MGSFLSSSTHKDDETLSLNLVDIRVEVDVDLTGEKLRSLWQDISNTAGVADGNDDDLVIRKHISSFLKRSDQYMALVSVLLKSRSYYVAATLLSEQQDEIMTGEPLHPRPIRSLPRTEHGKPHLTLPPLQENRDFISVSHQYPFVGLVHRHSKNSKRKPTSVGLDIVAFDPLQENMYASLDDFLDCFRDSFQDYERNMIHQVQQSRGDVEALREFYLWWAVKEAYTKALGVGLGFDFSKFYVSFANGASPSFDGLWRELAEGMDDKDVDFGRGKQARQLLGRIVMSDSAASMAEPIPFLFVPLYGSGDMAKDPSQMQGCACICLTGAFQGDSLRTTIQWRSLHELIQFHTRSGVT